ncbi:hypothetical protein G6F57_023874 [Rhizopus arrhizus]|nr:hypothetical protein G6F57_023874 [Rhizopus arrhizus]
MLRNRTVPARRAALTMTATAGFCMAWAPGKAEEMDWRGKRAGPAQWPAAQFTIGHRPARPFPCSCPSFLPPPASDSS